MDVKANLWESVKASLKDSASLPEDPPAIFSDIFKLQKALDELRKQDPQLVSILEMLFVGGFTREEISHVLGLSMVQVDSRLEDAVKQFIEVIDTVS